MLSQQLTVISSDIIDLMVMGTLATIMLSGIDYVFVWGRRAVSVVRKKVKIKPNATQKEIKK